MEDFDIWLLVCPNFWQECWVYLWAVQKEACMLLHIDKLEVIELWEGQNTLYLVHSTYWRVPISWNNEKLMLHQLSAISGPNSIFFKQASALIKDICTNLCAASKESGNADYTIVLRGDSTLRGHFPQASLAPLEWNGRPSYYWWIWAWNYDPCRKQMLLFLYLGKWTHGLFAPSFFKEDAILLMMCIMLQILIGISLWTKSVCVYTS